VGAGAGYGSQPYVLYNRPSTIPNCPNTFEYHKHKAAPLRSGNSSKGSSFAFFYVVALYGGLALR